jgi:hypothetical protein
MCGSAQSSSLLPFVTDLRPARAQRMRIGRLRHNLVYPRMVKNVYGHGDNTQLKVRAGYRAAVFFGVVGNVRYRAGPFYLCPRCGRERYRRLHFRPPSCVWYLLMTVPARIDRVRYLFSGVLWHEHLFLTLACVLACSVRY